jgi:molybdopterin/thiamine biosynthesis adenylyltransferase/DNA-directed RNA polymerase subunit RPC12/RpoP
VNRNRYLRQQGVDGLAVARLSAMRVAVVGAGAVGNEVVKNLALMGVGAIDVHDFDDVEVHNLTRSVFLRESDVGTSKARAVVARAADVDPSVRLRAIEGDAWRTLRHADVERLDVVIAAVDNLEARMHLSQLCLLAATDFINAGIDSRYASVEVFPHASDAPHACFECHLPGSAYRRVAERYSCGWLRRAMLVEDAVPTTAITASVAGALAVQAALRVGGAARDGARRILVDTRTGAGTSVSLERNDACAGCATLVPPPRRIAARGDWRGALATHAPAAAAVLLSDALIFGYTCASCGTTLHASSYVGRRADEFDDRIMRCAQCGELAARVDIRSESTVGDLQVVFGDALPPVKFLLANAGEPGAICIDLEE